MNDVVIICVLVAIIIGIVFGAISCVEAKKQNRSDTKWFFIGFIFGFNAFIGLKVSQAADEEGHDVNLWSILGVLGGLATIIAFESGLNAENKCHDFSCWVLLGFMFGLAGLFVSCFLKSFEKKSSVLINASATKDWTCENCGTKNSSDRNFCKRCARIRPKN